MHPQNHCKPNNYHKQSPHGLTGYLIYGVHKNYLSKVRITGLGLNQ